MDDFGLKLQGQFDESSIQKKLQSMDGKFNLVVNLKFDSSQIQKELDKLKVKVKSVTDKGTTDSASSKVGGVPSVITTPIVGDVSKTKTEFDATGKIVGGMIEKMRTLDSITKEYYKTAEDGSTALIKSEQTRDTGLKKQLQLQNQNEKSIRQMTYSLNEFKNQGSLTDKEFQNFSNTLKEVGSGENFEQVGFELKSLNKSINESVKLNNQNEKSIYGTGEAIKYLGNQSKLSKKEVEVFNARLEEIKTDALDPIERSKALTKLNTDIKTAANSTGILGQSFAKAATKYVTWLGIATAVALAQRALKNMVSEVVQLDTAMVELNKVFDATDSQLNKVKNSAFELASQLGTTGLEVINATTEFKRMGYTIDESLDLAKVAIMLTNVAEGLNDAGEAASIITSILKGLKVEADYAESILDRLNEVSNNNAVSLATLADMAQRASATMNILGNTFDETLGLLTGAYEVLQDERVAKGIQTIGLRIAGLNEDLETEVGLANQVTKALQKYAGINVFDEQTGQIKSTYAILEELSKKWDTLNKNTQVTIQNILGGKERADVVAAILTNWEGVSDAVQDAANSMGSARKEQEAFLKSIVAGFNEVKNAFMDLAQTLIPPELITSISGLAKSLLVLVKPFAAIVSYLLRFVQLSAGIEGVASFFEALGNALLKVLEYGAPIMDAFISIGDALMSGALGVLNTILDGVIWALDKILSLLKPIFDIVKSIFDWFSNATNDVINFFKRIFGVSEDVHKDLAETFNKKGVDDYNNSLLNLKNSLSGVNQEAKDYLDIIKKQREELKKEKELNDKLLDIEKKRLALTEAKRKKVTVFRSGVGYVQATDVSEVQTAEEELQEAINALSEYKYEQALSRAEEFVEKFQEILTGDNILEGWRELFAEFGDLLDTEFADYLIKANEFVEKFNNEWVKTNFATETTNSNNNNSGNTSSWGGGNNPNILELPKVPEVFSDSNSYKLNSITNSPNKYLKSGSGGTVLQFNGDLSFPNVKNSGDAQGFVQALKDLGVSKTPKLV